MNIRDATDALNSVTASYERLKIHTPTGEVICPKEFGSVKKLIVDLTSKISKAVKTQSVR